MNDIIFFIVFGLAFGFLYIVGYNLGYKRGMSDCFAHIMAIGEIMGKKKVSENEAMASAENAGSFTETERFTTQKGE